MITLIAAGITNVEPTVSQYPMTGPAATTANVRDVIDAASMQNLDITQIEIGNGAARLIAEMAAVTGVGAKVDVYA